MINSKPETVVVTGGTAGIGRATAREFARHGCNVAVLARGKDGLEATKRDIEELGGVALAIETDVADWNAVEAAADRVERELGPIDIWINNAFAGIFSRFMDITPDEYARVTDVTYLGQVNGTRAALKRMLPRDEGSIVLVGSALAYRGIPLQSAYCGAKHAIQGFIDSVRCELLHDKSNVTITMVQMPGVNTPQFDWIRAKLPGQPRPVGKVYQPEVAARAIYFAAHDGRKEMLVGLPTVEAVWGNKIASSMLDEYLA
ncbi:MAG TPA: SDR family oxidoreductase, partial [Sphingomicrobium sp.]|nr:SDR family oxidoreductase [Sphingomicrobium sp.]